MDPTALNLRGATQPEIFRGTVEDMVRALQADADRFWTDALAADGPIEIWEIAGVRFLANGNHRFQAARLAGVDIPNAVIVVRDKTGSGVLTFPFDRMTWLPGRK